MKTKSKNESGIAALLAIVVIAAAALIIAYSASILGLGELEMGYASLRSSETFSIADACAEESLRQLRINTGYTGETLSIGKGSCIISVASAGVNRTVNVTATSGEYNQKIKIDLSLSGNVITIVSWEEVST
ncbi:hypothetical protein KKC32_02045 [Patescibacteria group bacterium]|nr:hypothetical protein [Patescibacteria group bacterium]